MQQWTTSKNRKKKTEIDQKKKCFDLPFTERRMWRRKQKFESRCNSLWQEKNIASALLLTFSFLLFLCSANTILSGPCQCFKFITKKVENKIVNRGESDSDLASVSKQFKTISMDEARSAVTYRILFTPYLPDGMYISSSSSSSWLSSPVLLLSWMDTSAVRVEKKIDNSLRHYHQHHNQRTTAAPSGKGVLVEASWSSTGVDPIVPKCATDLKVVLVYKDFFLGNRGTLSYG